MIPNHSIQELLIFLHCLFPVIVSNDPCQKCVPSRISKLCYLTSDSMGNCIFILLNKVHKVVLLKLIFADFGNSDFQSGSGSGSVTLKKL